MIFAVFSSGGGDMEMAVCHRSAKFMYYKLETKLIFKKSLGLWILYKYTRTDYQQLYTYLIHYTCVWDVGAECLLL